MTDKKTKDSKPQTEEDHALGLDRISTEITVARGKLGISQSELASRTGISRNAIMGYESGRNKPGAREIRLICEVLRITPNKLLFGHEAPFDYSEEESITVPKEIFSDERLLSAFAGLKFSLLLREEQMALLTLVDNLLKARSKIPFSAHIWADGEAVRNIAENMDVLRKYGVRKINELLSPLDESNDRK